LKELCKILKLDADEVEDVAVVDRIRAKFGPIPTELTGKNPELEPIERYWPKLSKRHKADIITMVQVFAKQDTSAGE
jgi:hypothetical protein